MKEFGREGGAGEKLQQALQEKTKNKDSWVGARGGGGGVMMEEGWGRDGGGRGRGKEESAWSWE